ncbi:VOC family protein, partial [Mycolicibacterium elephantis]
MPVRTVAPVGAPTWIDLASSDLERSKQFYGAVFGWTFESAGPEYGGYVTAFKDGKPVAGLMHNDPQWNSPDGWTIYFHTADIKATLNSAVAAGAISCMEPVEPMEIKDKGWMGMLSDPTGAMFGLWQPTGHRGF